VVAVVEVGHPIPEKRHDMQKAPTWCAKLSRFSNHRQ
jgi:hypothetical protein